MQIAAVENQLEFIGGFVAQAVIVVQLPPPHFSSVGQVFVSHQIPGSAAVFGWRNEQGGKDKGHFALLVIWPTQCCLAHIPNWILSADLAFADLSSRKPIITLKRKSAAGNVFVCVYDIGHGLSEKKSAPEPVRSLFTLKYSAPYLLSSSSPLRISSAKLCQSISA